MAPTIIPRYLQKNKQRKWRQAHSKRNINNKQQQDGNRNEKTTQGIKITVLDTFFFFF